MHLIYWDEILLFCNAIPQLQHLSHLKTFYSDEEVEMVVHEWLQMQEPVHCCDRVLECVQTWDKGMSGCGIMFWNSGGGCNEFNFVITSHSVLMTKGPFRV